MDQPDFPLQLQDVSRVYPRDVSKLASSVMREMFLPIGILRSCPPTHFHALRSANLVLADGEKLGVLGSHRSGKSTLAGIASGQLQPTSGRILFRGRRSLIARPGAGFRPGVSVVDNLSFRAKVHGLTGEVLREAVDRTLASCGVDGDQAQRAIGNLSRFVQRQLGLTLLLELPADILVVDEVTGAGTGDARWELRGRLQDRVEAATALVLSADPAFLRDFVPRACVLHAARLYGPFDIDQATEVFENLPDEDDAEEVPDAAFDPLDPPHVGAGQKRRGSDLDVDQDDAADGTEDGDGDGDGEAPVRGRKGPAVPWRALGIMVDGEEFRHSRISLIRAPGSAMQVTLQLVSQADQEFTGGMFILYGGSSGTEVGRLHDVHTPVAVRAGERMTLSFGFIVPDWGEDFYGLAFCPQTDGRKFVPEHRLKVLIYGVGRKHDVRVHTLDIRNSSFERNLDNASLDTLPGPPEGQQTKGKVGGEVRAAA